MSLASVIVQGRHCRRSSLQSALHTEVIRRGCPLTDVHASLLSLSHGGTLVRGCVCVSV